MASTGHASNTSRHVHLYVAQKPHNEVSEVNTTRSSHSCTWQGILWVQSSPEAVYRQPPPIPFSSQHPTSIFLCFHYSRLSLLAKTAQTHGGGKCGVSSISHHISSQSPSCPLSWLPFITLCYGNWDPKDLKNSNVWTLVVSNIPTSPKMFRVGWKSLARVSGPTPLAQRLWLNSEFWGEESDHSWFWPLFTLSPRVQSLSFLLTPCPSRWKGSVFIRGQNCFIELWGSWLIVTPKPTIFPLNLC